MTSATEVNPQFTCRGETTDAMRVRSARDATHYCVKSRGVMDANSTTQTTSLGGCFKTDASTRAEFLA